MLQKVKKLGRQVRRNLKQSVTSVTSHKVLFEVFCRDLIVDSHAQIEEGALLSVCFERGGKLAVSMDHVFHSHGSSPINESLKLVSTMYQQVNETNAPFERKKGKLILRKAVPNKFGGISYHGLGVIVLRLDELVDNEFSSMTKDMTVAFDDLPGVSLNFTLSYQMIEKQGSTDLDETMSVMSSISDTSDFSASISASFDSPQKLDLDYSNPQQYTFSSPQRYTHETIPEEEEVEPLDDTKGSLAVSCSSDDTNSSPLNLSPLSETKHTSNTTNRLSPVPSIRNQTPARSFNPIKLSTHSKFTIESLQETKYERTLSPKHGNTTERVALHAKIDDMQREIDKKDELILRLNSQLDEKDVLYRKQLLALRTELNEVKQQLKREHISKQVIQSAHSKADMTIAQALSKAREESDQISKEYSQVAAELETSTETISQLKEELMLSLTERSEIEDATREAATAATIARMKLLETEEENNDLIDELISAKMGWANCASQCEEERRKNFLATRKQQKYAQRVAELEVQLCSSAQANESNDEEDEVQF